MRSTVIEIDRLCYHFGRQKVLDGVSLAVPEGCIYGLIGPNGAGKTTLLKLALGLLKKQEGVIRIFGKDPAAQRVDVLRRTGSLIEQPSLYLHLTARENLEIYRLTFGSPKVRVDEVLQIVRLPMTGEKKVRAFSLGMRQRLAIAIALMPDPALLILDEPSNGLDPVGMLEMRRLLRDLNDKGKTVIVSSHLLGELEKIADAIAVLHKGRLLFEGEMEQLRQMNNTADLETLFVDLISKNE